MIDLEETSRGYQIYTFLSKYLNTIQDWWLLVFFINIPRQNQKFSSFWKTIHLTRSISIYPSKMSFILIIFFSKTVGFLFSRGTRNIKWGNWVSRRVSRIRTPSSDHYPKVVFSILCCLKSEWRDFPGGAVVKNPPAKAGDTGSSSGPVRSHMLQSNKALVPQLLSLHSTACKPQLLSPQRRVAPARHNYRKPMRSSEDSTQPSINKWINK